MQQHSDALIDNIYLTFSQCFHISVPKTPMQTILNYFIEDLHIGIKLLIQIAKQLSKKKKKNNL